jgi:HAE1 family hydrophobic/amphiphilic exporter-1
VISHFNLFRSANKRHSQTRLQSGQAIEALQEVAKTLPAGYGYEFAGLSKQEIEAGSSTIYILCIVNCICVFVSDRIV